DINLDFVIDPRKSIFDTLLNTREPLVVEDSKNDERVNQKYAAFVKTKSFVLIPIVSKEEVIGIIGVDNLFSKRSVNEINVDLLVTLANHAAIAISNSRLFESTQLFNEKLQEEVRLATEHLEKLLDMKSHFLQVASHQLRTPTTILRGLLSMILEDPEMKDEEKHKNMGQAYTVVNRLDRIIAELLSATELEDTIDRPIIEKVNLLELIQQIVNELKPLAYDRKNKLIVHIPESVDEVYSNPFKLKEAISNLVDNALRYTQKGTVTISVEDNGAEISVHVIDTGVGLTEEDKKIIFDKFSRGLKISQVEPNGTGLGLFIVQRIAEMLDGKIECLSEGEGKGSEFILIFPNTRG
ncbi:MAG: GAF domain-containing sensor histidine kinase, partial [Candidatus Thermoplasmatota archaeon]|nr:GAF domain-containing sensor histidine kinase [Candidatus Thermoplasmatota archaeon]